MTSSANVKVSETDLWSWLSKSRRHLREDLHINRIENSVIPGMPDVEGCFRGHQFWIELKCASRPKNEGHLLRIKFQPDQPEWIRRRLKAGLKRVYVLIQVGRCAGAGRYLVPGNYVEDLVLGVTEENLEYMIDHSPTCCAESLLQTIEVEPNAY